MRHNVRNIFKGTGRALIALFLIFVLGACNNEDDVMQIFNGKTWKLTRMANSKSDSQQFYSGLWSNSIEESASRAALREENNFTIEFKIDGSNERANGSAEVKGVKATMKDVKITVNGQTNAITFEGNIVGSETDKLARAFINALPHVYKYEGDEGSLTLFYREGQSERIMGFAAR